MAQKCFVSDKEKEEKREKKEEEAAKQKLVY